MKSQPNIFRTLAVCLLFALHVQGQNYPQDYFASPLKIPLLLSGNFGELRNNHFHAGIDIKTSGKEGLDVLASADGYVSRIKIQEGGYGKTIYITHPNGYTTVYAHLQSYVGDIARLAKEEQYAKESYTIELFPDSNQVPVKKGQLIGLSGNTGGSGGPHLHFEIRETITEVPVNPLLFNFPIKDNIAPEVKGVLVYPLDARSSVNGKREAQYFAVSLINGKYQAPIIKASGRIGLGVETNDYLNQSNNRCGVYDILLEVNKEKIYQFKTEKIAFDQSRYINAHCDYAYRKRTGKWIHLIYSVPNNGLNIYPINVNNGVINVLEDSLYQIDLTLKDAYQNAAVFKTVIMGEHFDPIPIASVPKDQVASFDFQKESNYQTDSFKIYIPAGALYDHLDFRYQKVLNTRFLSSLHCVHDYEVPLHEAATYSIRCSRVPSQPSKVVVVAQNKGGKVYIKGEYINGWVNFNYRGFANFLIDQDTTAPTVKTANFVSGQEVSALGKLTITIKDFQSGIASYKAYLNGKWVLMEYDYKKQLLTYDFDGHFVEGSNKLKLLVQDAVGNETVFETEILFNSIK